MNPFEYKFQIKSDSLPVPRSEVQEFRVHGFTGSGVHGFTGSGHSRQAKNMGGWYMREISIYKLQIPNKLQKANYKSQTKAKN